ncbi:hypothetical protein ACLB1T_10465 [Escherichia coli]
MEIINVGVPERVLIQRIFAVSEQSPLRRRVANKVAGKASD